MQADYFERASYADIADLVATKTEESHTLEFKRKSSASDSELNKDDRRLLGEALSGFANATGGALVLGVATERHQGCDRASALAPIQNVQIVAQRYRAYANECVSPPIEGLKIRAIADREGTGLIAILVPRGHARPHMSTAPNHHTYYRRVMDSFVPMQHYEVEEMMRLKTAPELSLYWKISPAGSSGHNKHFVIFFGLKNTSNMTAKFPFISYLDGRNSPRVAPYGLDGNGHDLWPRFSNGASDAVTFSGGSNYVVHPGQELFVSKLEYNEHYDPQSRRDWGVSELDDQETLTLHFSFGCEDQPMKTQAITFTKKQLLGNS